VQKVTGCEDPLWIMEWASLFFASEYFSCWHPGWVLFLVSMICSVIFSQEFVSSMVSFGFTGVIRKIILTNHLVG
jgi:hypothetical protein